MNIYSEITPEILSLTKLAESTSKIDPALYTKYDVKRGLRDINGKGVLAGLTDIGNVHAYDMVDGKQVPCEGKLYYRGYNIEDLVNGFIRDQRFGFEEVTYLLLFGKLPSKEDLKEFSDMLAAYRSLPTSFVRDIILKAPSQDMMNTLARSVLTLYTYDDRADDISLPNVLRQCGEDFQRRVPADERGHAQIHGQTDGAFKYLREIARFCPPDDGGHEFRIEDALFLRVGLRNAEQHPMLHVGFPCLVSYHTTSVQPSYRRTDGLHSGYF